MMRKLLVIAGILGIVGVAVVGALYATYPVQFVIFGALIRNYFLTWSAPPGATTTELNAAYKALPVAPSPLAGSALPGSAAAGDWPAITEHSLRSVSRRSARSIRNPDNEFSGRDCQRISWFELGLNGIDLIGGNGGQEVKESIERQAVHGQIE